MENQLTARRSGRIHVRMPVTLCGDFESRSNEHTVSTVDFSNNGVRVCAKASLVPGQTVAISTNSEHRVTLAGHVVWIGPVGTRLEGQAGIEFLKPVILPA